MSAAIVQECGQNDFVLFTNVEKFLGWIENEVNKTYNKNDFNDAFNAFDEEEVNQYSGVISTDCKYQLIG